MTNFSSEDNPLPIELGVTNSLKDDAFAVPFTSKFLMVVFYLY